MGWICKFCSTNNDDSATRCIACDKPRSYAVTRTLTPIRVMEFGFCGDVIIPEEYNVIGVGAFQNRTDITSVTIHSGVKKILKEAFSGCTNLRDVKNNAELISIGARAFYGCCSLLPEKRPTARNVHEEAFAGYVPHPSRGDRPDVSAPSSAEHPSAYSSSGERSASTSDVTAHPSPAAPRAEGVRSTVHASSSAGTDSRSSGFKRFVRGLIVGIAVAAAAAIAFIFNQLF